MASSGGGRYMAYSPSPSAPHSPHISSLRSASSAILDQEKYLSELLAERHKLSPFTPILPNTYKLLNQAYNLTMLTADSCDSRIKGSQSLALAWRAGNISLPWLFKSSLVMNKCLNTLKCKRGAQLMHVV